MAMFEDFTFETLMEDALSRAPDDIDTREGSVYWDAVAGAMLKVARLYEDLEFVLSLAAVDTATGEALDSRASEFGLTRKDAVTARYAVSWEGTTPSVGDEFYFNGVYFSFTYDSDADSYYLDAVEGGVSANDIEAGSNPVPVYDIAGLTSITFGACVVYGVDEETDDSLRDRIKTKVSGPTENANRAQYESWCESVTGVYQAFIYPLWNGPNTVKAVLVDANGEGCADTVVKAVQDYIDPANNGDTVTIDGVTYTVGDGLGEGAAPIGAHFTAIGARPMNISVSFSASLATGYTKAAIQAAAETAISQYFRSLSVNYDRDQELLVYINKIGAVISAIDGLDDYSDLTANGQSSGYLSVNADMTPVLQEVVVS